MTKYDDDYLQSYYLSKARTMWLEIMNGRLINVSETDIICTFCSTKHSLMMYNAMRQVLEENARDMDDKVYLAAARRLINAGHGVNQVYVNGVLLPSLMDNARHNVQFMEVIMHDFDE